MADRRQYRSRPCPSDSINHFFPQIGHLNINSGDAAPVKKRFKNKKIRSTGLVLPSKVQFMSSKKSNYRNLCKKEYLPLQMQPWWWDAVCGENNWNVSLSKINNGEIIGALPYFKTTKMGFSMIKMPPFTTYNGPWIKPIREKTIKLPAIYAHQKKVISELADNLPNVSFYSNSCSTEFKNHLPFYWKNFGQTTRYTFELRGFENAEAIYSNFKRSVRTDLKKAAETCFVHKTEDAALLHRLTNDSFKRQNMAPAYNLATLQKLNQALAERNARTIYLALDKETEKAKAGLFVVHDQHSVHCLISGQMTDFKDNGAIYLLFWEAIKEHYSPSGKFDFEGSMVPNIEHFLRSFGGELTPYCRIFKTKNKLLELLASLSGKF